MHNHELNNQNSDSSENPWAAAMADVPPFELDDTEHAKDNPEPTPVSEARPNDNSLETLSPTETMVARAEADGYQPQHIGECSVLSVNQDGKIRIESQYRELWSQAAQQDPDFYNDPANQELSHTLWNLGNQAMFQDINPKSAEDQHTFDKIYSECAKLQALSQNPNYRQHIENFLDQLEDLGESGASIVAINEVAQFNPTTPDNAPKLNPELQRKQEYYDQLNQIYTEVTSSPSLDSDELAQLAAAYQDLGDFADAKDRSGYLHSLLDHLESLTNLFD